MASRPVPRSSSSKDVKASLELKCREIVTSLLLRDENKLCADCCSKGPRWASWNLGVYLCIRCAGLHRKMGVHISKIKSVDLDSWTPDQVSCMEQMGNLRGRESYEAKLDLAFARPQTDSSLELFIREKYEGLRYAKDGFQLPKAAERIEWLEEFLAGKTKRKPAHQTDMFFPALAKPPGFSGIASKIEQNSSSKVPETKNDLLGLEIETAPAPAPPPQPKEDLATLLGGDDLVPPQSPSQLTNESILALYNGGQSATSWAVFGN